MQLLAVGDLHLGRAPARVPESVRTRVGERALGPSAALARLVEQAVEARVDAVAFAGDLVEQEDDFFEAYAELRRAVGTLVDAGIAVVGVAGNHDVRVLPQLAREVPGFRLLGAGGTWEAVTLTGADDTTVRVHGWSFPPAATADNPLTGVAFPRDALPALGLLHCDRDQPGSRHAPVTSQQLRAAGLDAWLLGHIHKPDALDAQAPSGYLGSVTALRASETGAHGPWLYTIDPGGVRAVEQWTLAPLRWEALDVDLTGLDEAGDARSRIIAAANAAGEAIAAAAWRPRAVGLRIRLHGRTPFRRAVHAQLEAGDLDSLPLPGGVEGFIGRWWLETRPALDLATLALRPDPVGLLAARVRLLEGESGEAAARAALVDRARDHLARVRREPAWSGLDEGPPDTDAAVAEWLRQGALAALDELLAGEDAGASA